MHDGNDDDLVIRFVDFVDDDVGHSSNSRVLSTRPSRVCESGGCKPNDLRLNASDHFERGTRTAFGDPRKDVVELIARGRLER